MSKRCNECAFGILEDFGYSNYTVEGTNFRCAGRHHPDGEFDNFYGEDKRLLFAEQCEHHKAGEPVYMDCESECLATLTPEEKIIWEMDQAAS